MIFLRGEEHYNLRRAARVDSRSRATISFRDISRSRKKGAFLFVRALTRCVCANTKALLLRTRSSPAKQLLFAAKVR